MIYFGDSDIPMMFADFGFPVQIGDVTGVGIPDSEDEVFQSGDIPGRGGVVLSVSQIRVQTSAFPSVAIDDPVVLFGQNYSVREALRKGDGALTTVLLGAP